jgi:hypothetical protein
MLVSYSVNTNLSKLNWFLISLYYSKRPQAVAQVHRVAVFCVLTLFVFPSFYRIVKAFVVKQKYIRKRLCLCFSTGRVSRRVADALNLELATIWARH